MVIPSPALISSRRANSSAWVRVLPSAPSIYTKSPDGSTQAIDSNFDILNLNGGLFVYEPDSRVLLEMGANVDVGLNDHTKTTGGAYTNFTTKIGEGADDLKFGLALDVDQDKVLLTPGIQYSHKNWTAGISAKLPTDQTNSNFWDASTIGVDFSYRPMSLDQKLELEEKNKHYPTK